MKEMADQPNARGGFPVRPGERAPASTCSSGDAALVGCPARVRRLRTCAALAGSLIVVSYQNSGHNSRQFAAKTVGTSQHKETHDDSTQCY
jgi:hypothetical protein